MQITLTFDGMEEFLRYVDMRGKINTTFTDFSPAEIKETLTRRLDAAAVDKGTGAIVGATQEEQRQEEARETAQAAAVPEKKPKAKKNPPKEEKPAEEPTAAQEEAPANAPEDLEKLRPKARKILSELNEATGTNTARQLIKKLGAENLKMLPAEKLPELIKMAEEDLADAQ
jgi:hypothetical protein